MKNVETAYKTFGSSKRIYGRGKERNFERGFYHRPVYSNRGQEGRKGEKRTEKC